MFYLTGTQLDFTFGVYFSWILILVERRFTECLFKLNKVGLYKGNHLSLMGRVRSFRPAVSFGKGNQAEFLENSFLLQAVPRQNVDHFHNMNARENIRFSGSASISSKRNRIKNALIFSAFGLVVGSISLIPPFTPFAVFVIPATSILGGIAGYFKKTQSSDSAQAGSSNTEGTPHLAPALSPAILPNRQEIRKENSLRTKPPALANLIQMDKIKSPAVRGWFEGFEKLLSDGFGEKKDLNQLFKILDFCYTSQEILHRKHILDEYPEKEFEMQQLMKAQQYLTREAKALTLFQREAYKSLLDIQSPQLLAIKLSTLGIPSTGISTTLHEDLEMIEFALGWGNNGTGKTQSYPFFSNNGISVVLNRVNMLIKIADQLEKGVLPEIYKKTLPEELQCLSPEQFRQLALQNMSFAKEIVEKRLVLTLDYIDENLDDGHHNNYKDHTVILPIITPGSKLIVLEQEGKFDTTLLSSTTIDSEHEMSYEDYIEKCKDIIGPLTRVPEELAMEHQNETNASINYSHACAVANFANKLYNASLRTSYPPVKEVSDCYRLSVNYLKKTENLYREAAALLKKLGTGVDIKGTVSESSTLKLLQVEKNTDKPLLESADVASRKLKWANRYLKPEYSNSSTSDYEVLRAVVDSIVVMDAHIDKLELLLKDIEAGNVKSSSVVNINTYDSPLIDGVMNGTIPVFNVVDRTHPNLAILNKVLPEYLKGFDPSKIKAQIQAEKDAIKQIALNASNVSEHVADCYTQYEIYDAKKHPFPEYQNPFLFP